MKTAVEWLQDTWLNYPDLCSYDKIQEWFEQAKEMEKKQMLRFYHEGSFAQMRYFDGKGYVKAEQYYNETFKSK